MNTIMLFSSGETIVKKLYLEYVPDYVFYDGMAYQYSHSKNDTLYYMPCGNAISF